MFTSVYILTNSGHPFRALLRAYIRFLLASLSFIVLYVRREGGLACLRPREISELRTTAKDLLRVPTVDFISCFAI